MRQSEYLTKIIKRLDRESLVLQDETGKSSNDAVDMFQKAALLGRLKVLREHANELGLLRDTFIEIEEAEDSRGLSHVANDA